MIMSENRKRHIALLDKYIKQEASKEEIKELSVWMESTDSSLEFDSYCEQQWNLSSDEINQQLSAEIWYAIEDKVEVNQRKKFRINPLFYRVAAMILLPLCIAMGGYLAYMSSSGGKLGEETFQVLVDKGQKANIILPEGTKVWINSGTKISYNYIGDILKLDLDGEAYFEVAKNPNRRFIVNSNDLNIESLGTTFNVKGYLLDNIVAVSLLEGKVKVYNETQQALLEPNKTIYFDRKLNTFTQADIKDSREVDFWRRNILYFRSATLAEIGKTLERMYGVTIKFEDESLKDVSFSGSIRNSSLNNVFHIISLTYPITYTIENDTITIKKDK